MICLGFFNAHNRLIMMPKGPSPAISTRLFSPTLPRATASMHTHTGSIRLATAKDMPGGLTRTQSGRVTKYSANTPGLLKHKCPISSHKCGNPRLQDTHV
jgi:hypothetical protein